MRTWVDVATLVKTKSLDGRFVVKSTAGLPFLLEGGMEVSFVPPQLDVPRSAVVESVRELDGRSAEVVFEGVDGEAARVLVGSHCLVERGCIDDAVFEASPGAWEGWSVIDADAGEIGPVLGIIENPGQDLLEVARTGAPSVLVPLVGEFVLEVDVDAKSVHVELPKGLLDL